MTEEQVDIFIQSLPNRKIKPFEFVMKYDGLLHDVCSINKKKKTVRLYYEYGTITVNLSDIQTIQTEEEYSKEEHV